MAGASPLRRQLLDASSGLIPISSGFMTSCDVGMMYAELLLVVGILV